MKHGTTQKAFAVVVSQLHSQTSSGAEVAIVNEAGEVLLKLAGKLKDGNYRRLSDKDLKGAKWRSEDPSTVFEATVDGVAVAKAL